MRNSEPVGLHETIMIVPDCGRLCTPGMVQLNHQAIRIQIIVPYGEGGKNCNPNHASDDYYELFIIDSRLVQPNFHLQPELDQVLQKSVPDDVDPNTR